MSTRHSNLDLAAASPNPLRQVRDQMLQFNQVRVLHACIQPNYFPEHHEAKLKIAIPLESALIQASWQTATGRQRQQWIKAGHVSIIPAYQPREILWQREAGLLSIYLGIDLIAQVAADTKLNNVEIVEQWTARDPFIQHLGLSLRTELNNGSASSLYVESMANLLAVHVLRHYSTTETPSDNDSPTISNRSLEPAIEYIHAHLTQDITLNVIAEVMQMSPFHFAPAFKQATGQSPHQYVLQCRIERAKDLLARSQSSISDISYQLGFSSQSHFTSIFRRFVAATPKAYRQALSASFNVAQDFDKR